MFTQGWVIQWQKVDCWYVLHKDLDNNILYADQGHEHPWMLSTRLEASQLAWVSGNAPEVESPLTAKVRYRQQDQAVTIEHIDENRMILEFRQAQRAVTPGQSVVLYDGDVCLGGGIIETMNKCLQGRNRTQIIRNIQDWKNRITR